MSMDPNAERTLYFVVMTRTTAPTEQDPKTAERMKDAVHLQYSPEAQVTFLGEEDDAIDGLRRVQQTILERRQKESRS